MVALSHALRRSRVLPLLLAVLTMVGSSGSWHAATDDPDCEPLSAHDHRAHHESLGPASHTTLPAHCAICHWLQAFRSGDVGQSRVPLAIDCAGVDPLLPSAKIRSTDRIALPSRAPPV